MDKKLFKSILLLITYTVVLVMVLSRLGLIAGGVAWVLGLVKPLLIPATSFSASMIEGCPAPGPGGRPAPWRWSPPIWC